MIRQSLARRSWSWMIAGTYCLPLIVGCAPPDADSVVQFIADLVFNAAAALLL